MDYKNLITHQEGSILTVTINRENKLNALNKDTLSEISAVAAMVDGNNSIHCVIITGAGTKAFVAGADISEFANFSVDQGAALSRDGHVTVFDKIESSKTPWIAAINGFALGGGLELAMACHIRVASDNAKVGLPEVSLGVIPGYGGTQRLSQLAGKGKAMEMMLTAGMLDAQEALTWGVVNHVTTMEELLPLANKIASKIARNSSIAIGIAIEAANAAYRGAKDGFEQEIESFGECFGTEDFKEGTTAFLEKRKPNFPGK